METTNITDLKKLYTQDYPLWVEENLRLITSGDYQLVDWENMIEEIKDMGSRHLESCISFMAVILEHLYKLDNFKDITGGKTAGHGWKRSIYNARAEIEYLIDTYPSLRNKIEGELPKAWNKARKKLIAWLKSNQFDANRFNIPQECPYSYEDIFKRDNF